MTGWQKDQIRKHAGPLFASIDTKLLRYKIGNDEADKLLTALLEIHVAQAKDSGDAKAIAGAENTLAVFQGKRKGTNDR